MSSAFSNYIPLYNHLLDQFIYGVDSIHGPEHWQQVAQNGLYLAHRTKVSEDIVILFALFHDAERDADRLDLVRIGISPDPDYMSTGLGKQIAYAGGIEEYQRNADA